MIDVDRHNMDMAALRACLKTLREGHPLGVFPEGTRHKEGVMEHMESGIAMIALRSGARPVSYTHLTMQFGGVVAVDSFSMHVDQGETVALIGPNGCLLYTSRCV